MKQATFNQLMSSVKQADNILKRKPRAPAKTSVDAPADVKEVRAVTKLSQAKFAAVLQVDVGTVRNWEQGRRIPTGPARALLRAIHADPQNVLRALQHAN
ncbi:MAG: helix-turn-helix domain-containing protein [Gammaproteobacteria bacterium]|nr:helix-turn-helix domain-containing protein [Gammaproteobacteria bacterium]